MTLTLADAPNSWAGDKPWVVPTFKPLAATDKLWGMGCTKASEVEKNPRRVAVDLLRIFLSIQTPITLWGPVGSRKTRTIERFAREHDENGTLYQEITLTPSLEDPTVVHGLMYTTQDADSGETLMKRSVPDVANQIIRYWEEHRGLTILFMDEMTTCMPAQQHALLGILTHARYGDQVLSDYITIAMAANPPGTVSTVNPLGEQVINRGGHIAWFGDVELYLEEWRSGFGDLSRAPDPDTDWYITSMLYEKYEAAFRAEKVSGQSRWSPDSLVPWELMENTERSVTELGKVLAVINEKFKGAPKAVRRAYIVQVTQALLGRDWARRMANVTEMEERRVSPQAAVDIVAAARVTSQTSIQELTEAVGGRIFTMNGARLSDSQVASVASGLYGMCARAERGFHREAYLTLWCMVATAPPSSLGLLHAYLTQLVLLAEGAMDRDLLPPSDAIPAFVSDETRQYLKSKLAQMR